jgi:hypothetical protein
MQWTKRVLGASSAAVAAAVAVTVGLSGHGHGSRAGADGVPVCASGQIANYLNQAGPGASDQFTDMPTSSAPGAVTVQSAFDAVDAGPKANGWDYTTNASTKGHYCAAFGLLTDTGIHLAGDGSALQYVNKPMWAVYVGGLHLQSSSNKSGSGTSAEHSGQVWFVDPATGHLVFATTVA